MNGEYVIRQKGRGRGTRVTFTPEAERYMAEQYPRTADKDTAALFGVTVTTVRLLARKMGLRKDPGYISGMRGSFRVPERVRKAAVTRARTVASERRRLIYGMPQRTRLRLCVSDPVRRRSRQAYRSRMKSKGYYVMEDGERVICYGDGTVRRPLAESHAASHGIRIMHISEYMRLTQDV